MPFELMGLDFVGREEREENLSGVYGDSFVGKHAKRRRGKGGRKGAGQGGKGGRKGAGRQKSAPSIDSATMDAALKKHMTDLGLGQKTSITKEEFKGLRGKLVQQFGKGHLGIIPALKRAGIKVLRENIE